LDKPVENDDTGGIEDFSAKENFRKILKVSHFYFRYSPNKNNNEIKHSQKVSLDFLNSDLENSNKTLYESKNADETLWKCLTLLWCSFHENLQ